MVEKLTASQVRSSCDPRKLKPIKPEDVRDLELQNTNPTTKFRQYKNFFGFSKFDYETSKL